jgi:UDP-glucose 4-epimerase
MKTKLSYANCLVTGGAGFIGSHLVKRLLEDGCNVTVIDDLSTGKWENLPEHSNLKKYKVSILQDMSKHVAGTDVIFHLAALSGVQRSIEQPNKTHEVNVTGTFNLLLAARDAGVKKFIFSSSMTVYGEQAKLPITEKGELKPMSPYAFHKKIGEDYCKLFTNLWGLPTISLRYFNVYGPSMYSSGASLNFLPKCITLMAQDKTPVIYGDGEQTRDFTYVDDVVEANILAASAKVSGKVFNIGSGQSFSLNKVVKLLNKTMGKNIEPIHEPAISEQQRSTLASFAKAKFFLGWQPKVKFKDGLKIAVQDLITKKQYHAERSI